MSDLVRFNFHGDELDVVGRDGHVFVAIRPMCIALGIDSKGQRAKLQTKPWAVGELISSTGTDGKRYEMFCLHIDSVPMWLATIEASKVAEHVRGKLLRYQLECARVLRDHFLGRPRRPEPAFGLGTAPVQSRIGDDPRAAAMLRGWFSMAAKATGLSIQALHGSTRKPWGVASVYRIPLIALDRTVHDLSRLIDGAMSEQQRQPTQEELFH